MRAVRTGAGIAGLALCAALTGCEPDVPPGPAAQLRALFDDLTDRQDPGSAWDRLPAAWQRDVAAWTRELAARVPEATYGHATACLRQLGVLLKRHADSMSAAAPLRALGSVVASASEDDITAAITALGDVLILVTRSELGDHARLARLDVGHFLHDTGAVLMRRAVQAVRVTGLDPLSTLRTTRIEEVRRQETSATVRLLPADGRPLELELTRVDGRWVPAALTTEWAALDRAVRAGIQRMGEALAGLDPGLLEGLTADLRSLDETTSRTAFERKVQDLAVKYRRQLRQITDGR